MKATDFVANLLADHGVRRAYGLQGGAVVHIFDSLERSQRVNCHYMHHEQSAALAAVADAKFSKDLGLVVVTTGPGGTNALTGLLAAWQDSVPVVFLSGQCRLDSTSYGRKVRQIGSQEFAILDVVRPMTKFCALLRSTAEIQSTLREAIRIAREGRPGPVWIDFPLDLQWQSIEEALLPASPHLPPPLNSESRQALQQVGEQLAAAKRPLIVAGHGLHLCAGETLFRDFITKHQIPVVTTWTGSDLLETGHPLNGGVIGLSGMRGANRLVFASDFLLILGANLSPTQVGSARSGYAPQARKVAITFDRDQLAASTVAVDQHIEADLYSALSYLGQSSQGWKTEPAWRDRCQQAHFENRRGSVNLDSDDVLPSGKLSSNVTVAKVTQRVAQTHHLVVDGGGTALYAGFQSATRGAGKRLICSSGMSAMGTGLAETVGVSLASGSKPVVTIIGDGSFLMNIQDLATIAQYRFPCLVVIINNHGYLAIKHTQRDYMDRRYYGTDGQNGLPIPDFKEIVEGFGLAYRHAESYAEVLAATEDAVSLKGPLVLDVDVCPDQDTLFRQAVRFNSDGTSAPSDLSEMWPYTPTASKG